MTKLKDMPPTLQPRERLLYQGENNLLPHELLAILLGTGTANRSVLHLAQDLLLHFGGLENLASASISELTQVRGVGKVKAIKLKAAFALGQKKDEEQTFASVELRNTHQIVAYARSEIGNLPKEALYLLLRDVKCRLLHREIIGLGTLSEVLVHPREVFQPAIKHNAASVVLCHNHPSGNPKPSMADIEMTHTLLMSAELTGIPLADHIIIGKKGFQSVKAIFSRVKKSQGKHSFSLQETTPIQPKWESWPVPAL